MRALEVQAHRRYQKVKDLQKEIEAYQGGFATKAEDAGTWKQFKLFVNRNRGMTVAVAVILILVVSSSVINYRARVQAVTERKRAVEKEEEARKALADLRNMTPVLVAQAKTYVEQHDLDKALTTISYAVELAKNSAEILRIKANILQALLKISDAEQAYDEVLKINPGDKSAKDNKALCHTILEENKGSSSLPVGAIGKLFRHMTGEDRYSEALAMIRRRNPGAASMDSFYREYLTTKKVKFNSFSVDDRGLCKLHLNETGTSDLSPLKGMPLSELGLLGCPVSDLTPLTGMPLTRLNLACALVADLAPLKGMPLTYLNLWQAGKITDLTPLKGMKTLRELVLSATSVRDLSPLNDIPLTRLDVAFMGVKDLSPLKGMPLTDLNLYQSSAIDLTPLKGMPLYSLDLGNTKVTDLTPLKDMPLKYIKLTAVPVSDWTPLRGMPLKELDLGSTSVSDVFPLKGMPLVSLGLSGTKVVDLSPLKGVPLERLNIGGTKVGDLTPLNGMPLTRLELSNTPVTDLTPLKDMVLSEIYFTPKNITKGIDILREKKSLKIIGTLPNDQNRWPAAEFWKKYDAGEFR